MSEQREPAELELAGLVPKKPSSELAARIAVELSAGRAPHRNWRPFGAAVGLVAAAVLLIWLAAGLLRPPVAPQAAPASAAALAKYPLPSVWNYQRLLAHSPESLDAVLDAHSARIFANAAAKSPLPAFGPFAINLHSMEGRL